MTRYEHEWQAERISGYLRCHLCGHATMNDLKEECPVRLRQALDEATSKTWCLMHLEVEVTDERPCIACALSKMCAEEVMKRSSLLVELADIKKKYNIKLPAVLTTDSGFVVCWSYENGYAELDFDKATGKVGWYCRDRTENVSIGSDADIEHIPGEFLEFIVKMFPAETTTKKPIQDMSQEERVERLKEIGILNQNSKLAKRYGGEGE